MEITSFILGVLAVIALAMVAITSVNYMTTKALKKDIDNLNISSDYEFENIYRRLEITDQEVYSRIDEVEQQGFRHTDSRVDKVINELERIKRTYIKEY